MAHSYETKARAIELRAEHTPVREIADMLGVSKSTVQTWVPFSARPDVNKDNRTRALDLRAAHTPVREIARILSVPQSTVSMWTARTTEKPMHPRFDTDLKRRALSMRAENYTARRIAAELNIPEQTVYTWIRQTRQRSIVLLDRTQTELRELADSLEDTPVRATLNGIARRLASARAGLNI